MFMQFVDLFVTDQSDIELIYHLQPRQRLVELCTKNIIWQLSRHLEEAEGGEEVTHQITFVLLFQAICTRLGFPSYINYESGIVLHR